MRMKNETDSWMKNKMADQRLIIGMKNKMVVNDEQADEKQDDSASCGNFVEKQMAIQKQVAGKQDGRPKSADKFIKTKCPPEKTYEKQDGRVMTEKTDRWIDEVE